MEEKQKRTDPRLDTPSEANREKHINFMEVEEGADRSDDREERKRDRERQEQWKDGLEEGRRASESHDQ